MTKNWIQKAIKHKGAFKAKAKAAGMSTKQYALKIIGGSKNVNDTTRRQAQLALTLMGLRKRK